MSLKSVLQNKYVCYLVLFISIMNILGYLAIQDFDSLVVFVAIGLLSSYFSKNMIIILGSALIGTNMIYANNKIHEGLKNKKKKKKKEKFGQRNVPKSKPAKVDDEDDDETDVGRIDQAATMEQAYDNLNKMLGKGGIGNLTKDTQGLMNQQKDLMNQLKDFQPMMKQAGDMLDKLGGMDNLNGIMGKLGGISGLAGGKKK